MERPTRRWTRRAWLWGASAGVGALVGRQCLPTSDPGPSFPLADEVIAHDRGIVLNDASQLSPTPVASHITVRDNSPKAAVERVRAALTEARIAGHPFIASAARYSMGGQSLARGVCECEEAIGLRLGPDTSRPGAWYFAPLT